jgi:hypothetical protein
MDTLINIVHNLLRPNSWTNPDKSVKSFPPCYSQSPLKLCLEISISSNSHNLLKFLLYTVKEKGGKPNRKPYIPPTEASSLKILKLCPETSTKLYVHEFGFLGMVS